MSQLIPIKKQLNQEFIDLLRAARILLFEITQMSISFGGNSAKKSGNLQNLQIAEKKLIELEEMAQRLVFEDDINKHKDQALSLLQIEIDKLRHRLSELEQFEKRAGSEGGVFISYSHADKPIVDSIEERFKADRINYWRDEKDLLVGQVIDKAISDGIQKSWIFMLIFSPNSVNSKWVEREFEEASHEEIEGNKFILPVVCGGLDVSEIPPRIRRKLYADITKDFDLGYQKIKQSILHNLEKQRRKGKS